MPIKWECANVTLLIFLILECSNIDKLCFIISFLQLYHNLCYKLLLFLSIIDFFQNKGIFAEVNLNSEPPKLPFFLLPFCSFVLLPLPLSLFHPMWNKGKGKRAKGQKGKWANGQMGKWANGKRAKIKAKAQTNRMSFFFKHFGVWLLLLRYIDGKYQEGSTSNPYSYIWVKQLWH